MAKTNQNTQTPVPVVQQAAPVEDENTMASKLATVALVGVAVALIEVELIPGMLIGVAAMMAPKLLPRLGNAFRPMVKSAVRAGYALADRTKVTMAEASEHFQDITAEVRAEQEPAHAAPRASAVPKNA